MLIFTVSLMTSFPRQKSLKSKIQKHTIVGNTKLYYRAKSQLKWLKIEKLDWKRSLFDDSWPTVLSKMNLYWIQGIALDWVRSYLTNRHNDVSLSPVCSLKGTGSRSTSCSFIKILVSNLFLILSVNNPIHVYLSDLRVHLKLEGYFRVTEVGWRSTKIAEKTSGLCQHGLFHAYGWLIYSYLQIFELIKCKWLPGECADWFLGNIMTWSYSLHRRYSMSWQKDSILTNEHALNREPVSLNAEYHREQS